MKSGNKTSRREFLTKTGMAAAGITIGASAPLSASNFKRVPGANDKINMGFIGVGNRGSQLLKLFMDQPDIRVAALCDVYEPYLLRDRNRVAKRYLELMPGQIPMMGEKFPEKPLLYKDYRKLLENKDIDAVCVATPDHWHALQVIDAIGAGKDVFVEKPLTNTLVEGRKMVEAQKRSDKVVAVGLNRRGNVVYQKLAREIPEGKIGKISVGRAARISNMAPDGIGKLKPESPPKDFDWDMWLGPREYRPYQYNIAPYMFRWWSHYSSQMGNWGVHFMDAIRWMMGETAPVSITAHGGKFIIDHDADIPDTMEVIFEFASKRMITFSIFEATGGEVFPYGELELRGTKGNVYVNERGYRIFPATRGQFQKWDKLVEEEEFKNPSTLLDDGSSADSTSGLIRNFIDCIRTRREPYCTLEEGHRSTSFAHLANIAIATQERLTWNPEKELFTNSEAANRLLQYEYRKPWKL
ncbi:MAG: Gfo/Idh/MocA family oxidoreductase [Bacteroidales bacterium]|jgi:predicted dehydrogenase|nr:Gfo/Idh/MocA family oxidoreductase [Bacteroidales bacterium]